jgi:hypothetical protein
MPLFNHIPNWNGLEIEVHPGETWRKKIRFWPYFIGQVIRFELVIRNGPDQGKAERQFHIIEKMPDVEKPKIITPRLVPERSAQQNTVFTVQGSSKITGKGEIKYWLSNRGYVVDSEPVFSAEAISLDSWVIPIILLVLGPLIGFLSGLALGLIIGG